MAESALTRRWARYLGIGPTVPRSYPAKNLELSTSKVGTLSIPCLDSLVRAIERQ